jgi:putative transposase
LRTYRWSSFPIYLVSANKRAEWLCLDRVLGEFGGGQNDRKIRRVYEEYIEGLAKRIYGKTERKGFDEEWKPIRRGWYLGGEDFRDRLLGMLGQAMRGKQKETYSGDEVRAHDQAQAEKFLRVGLSALELNEQDLRDMPKGAMEKQVLAWWLRRKMIVSRKWISERLRMGDVSRVTQAASLVSENENITFMRLKKRLERIS